MFYICDKCKRRWQYPLAECPHCLAGLSKMESKTAKAGGAVKVAIPTFFHPNVPYFVLLWEDENGNKWAQKSEKEYRPGEVLEFEPNREAVAVWRVKYDINEGIAKVLKLIGEIDIGQNTKIAVLPTLSKPSHAYFRDNTSPEFLAAVLETLLAKGAKKENIKITGQSFDEMPVAAIAQKSGLLEVCKKFGIIPRDIAAGEFEKTGKFEISKDIIGADIVVDLAMEKIGQAGAAMNLLKVLKKENYLGQKYLSSEAEIVAELEPALKEKLVVIGEAENVQRSNKLTCFAGLVLASRSALGLDRVFNEIAQTFKMPETIKDIALPLVVGRSIKEVQYQAEIF